jgi:hypothetical protein
MRVKLWSAFFSLIAFISVFVGWGTNAFAAELYVDSSNSFKTALAAAMPGDTIIVRCGQYTDATADTQGGFNPARSGTAQAPITIKSETLGCAVLRPRNNNVVALGIRERQYIVVEGFKVEGLLALNGTSFSTLQNNEVTVGGLLWGDVSLHWGIGVHTASHNNTIRNNRVHSMGNFGNKEHNTAAIMIGFNVRNNVIENNEADGGNGAVFSAFGQKGGDIVGNTWRNNIAKNAKAGFLGMGSTNGDLFSTNNIYYQNIAVNVEDAFRLDHNVNGWSIYNNTVYNVTLFLHSITGPSNANIRLWNNLVYQAVVAYDRDGATTSSFGLLTESNYNMFHRVTRMGSWNWGSGTIASLSSWKSIGFDANSTSADPLFVAAVQGNFKLQAGSPAKGVGKGGVDIGAYPTGFEVIGVNLGPRPNPPENLTVN